MYGRSQLAAIYIRVARQRDSARDGELPLQTRGLFQHEMEFSKIVSVRGRSQLSTFMKAYTAYARGRGSGTTVRFPSENQHLFLITENVL